MTEETVGNYFEKEAPFELFSSGSTLLDKALGGGWATRRALNISGESATAKSALAFEAAANFLRTFEDSRVIYFDSESAFNPKFQESMGIPLDKIEVEDWVETVEDVYETIEEIIKNNEDKKPIFMIVDSLDALSDRYEMKTAIDEGKYGTNKAKVISELFRKINSKMSKANVTFMTVSQLRENLDFGFQKTKRSGGKALKYYASQEVSLKAKGKEKRTVKGVENIIGQNIQAVVDKNRVGPAHDSATFTFLFDFGVDDLSSCLEYIKTVKKQDELGMDDKEIKKAIDDFRKNRMDADEYMGLMTKAAEVAQNAWDDIKSHTKISIKKY